VPADTFLKNVRRSGLIDQARLEAVLRKVPRDKRASAEYLSQVLVRQGLLSRFQAHKVMQGAVLGLVLGNYQVLAPLGKGGSGRVYLARDGRTEQLVALKVLPPKRAREKDRLVARFQREMQLTQLLAHPHLTQYYDSGIHQGIYYIAMEFLPGRTLYRLVSSQGPLPLARAARLFAEAAAGLDSAHGRGLIHRDLKPSNIIITPHDHAKVLDLGLAIMQGEEGDRAVVGGKGYVVGSMDYLAPEQAEDAVNVDGRADIYALGCTLYFALTGQPPFPGGDTRDKIRRHEKEEPASVHERNPAVPAAFDAVLGRLMAKRPDDRPASMAEVRELLLPWTSADPELPLDARGDAEYRQAVAEVENTEAFADMYSEDIVTPGRPNDGSSSFIGPAGANALITARGLRSVPLVYYLIPVGLAVLLLAGLCFLLLR
jgi:serine/threonine protein kinase